MRRQARWKRITILMLVAYAIGVSLNLVLRAALHGWQWYSDLLTSSLISGLLLPLLLLPISGIANKNKREQRE